MSLTLFLVYWWLPVYILLKTYYYIKKTLNEPVQRQEILGSEVNKGMGENGKNEWLKYRTFLKFYFIFLAVTGIICLLVKRLK